MKVTFNGKPATTTITYTAKGLVYGNFWGGGKGTYPSIYLKSDNKEELIQSITKGLDGRLDGGMGFERLIGAAMVLTTQTDILFEGNTYSNEKQEVIFVGDLTDVEKTYLEQHVWFSNYKLNY